MGLYADSIKTLENFIDSHMKKQGKGTQDKALNNQLDSHREKRATQYKALDKQRESIKTFHQALLQLSISTLVSR